MCNANCFVFKVSLSHSKWDSSQTSLRRCLPQRVWHLPIAVHHSTSSPSSHPEVTTTYLPPILNPGGLSHQKCHILCCVSSEFDLENVTAKRSWRGREPICYCLTVQSEKPGVEVAHHSICHHSALMENHICCSNIRWPTLPKSSDKDTITLVKRPKVLQESSPLSQKNLKIFRVYPKSLPVQFQPNPLCLSISLSPSLVFGKIIPIPHFS